MSLVMLVVQQPLKDHTGCILNVWEEPEHGHLGGVGCDGPFQETLSMRRDNLKQERSEWRETSFLKKCARMMVDHEDPNGSFSVPLPGNNPKNLKKPYPIV